VVKLSFKAELTPALEESLALELEAIRAEAMGWIPLEAGAYFHYGFKPESEEAVVIDMAGMNVLLLV
jgi:hypothetical protein